MANLFTDDKNEAINQLKSEHNKQLESLRKHFSQLEAQIQASDEVHRASKREAEILKGHLTLSTGRPGTPPASSTPTSFTSSVAYEAAEAALNNRGQRPRKSFSTITSSTAVNCRNDLRDHRPRSADAQVHPDPAMPEMLSPYLFESDVENSVLSSDEKKDLVKAFIKQFLEDNPEAVLDSKMVISIILSYTESYFG